MKQIDPETYFKALALLTPEKKALLESTEIYDVVEQLSKEIGSTIEIKKITIPIGDHILGLCTTEELLEEFSTLGILDSFTFLKKITDALNTPSKSNQVNINPAPATAENLNLRTMPMDMQQATQSQQPITPSEPQTQTPPAQIPVYQSSQATILNQPAPQPQSYTPPTPRWDTDNRQ